MTDQIHAADAAFEKWRSTQSCDSWAAHLYWVAWWAAWKQSRREALAELCERAERAAMGCNIRCAVTAMIMVEVIRAAAEEEGK